MTGRLVDFLLSRSARERALLGTVALLGLPLFIIFAVMLPLADSKSSAFSANRDAAALNNWVQERVRELATYADAPDIAPQTALGSSAIEESLISARLRPAVSELSVQDGGIIDLRFDIVTFTDLANWISANSPTWGYDITSFRFEATEVSGKIRASLSLTPQN